MPKFIEIHTLTSYPATLLNRDDVGFAKRLNFGGSPRVRVSSQCLKRHWRRADSDHALNEAIAHAEHPPMALRSRRTFDLHLFQPLVEEGMPQDVALAVSHAIVDKLLPKAAGKPPSEKDIDPEKPGETLWTGQVTVLGAPEMAYLRQLAKELVASSDETEAQAIGKDAAARLKKDKDLAKNLAALRHGAGLDAAMFGRMTTGDVLARCDAAVHVAHAFTVHEGFFETDYFSAVDDLLDESETGSGHINSSELTTGLYYGYSVIDVPLLVSNLEGCERADWKDADPRLASDVVRRYVNLVSTITPGAKLGATAPYSYAHAVWVESGDRQPRTLANAFLKPVATRNGDLLSNTLDAVAGHLGDLDSMFGGKDRARRLAAQQTSPELLDQVDDQVSLPELAAWAGEQVS